MKFTLAWLKEHLDTDAPLDEFGQGRVGVEVLLEPGQREFHRATPLARFLPP